MILKSNLEEDASPTMMPIPNLGSPSSRPLPRADARLFVHVFARISVLSTAQARELGNSQHIPMDPGLRSGCGPVSYFD